MRIALCSPPHFVFITCSIFALGGNTRVDGERPQTVQPEQFFAENVNFHQVTVSPSYASKSLGPQDQSDYVNAVVKAETMLTPLELLDLLQAREQEQGRVRLRRWGERTLDLDILLYNNAQIHSECLIIPYYDMQHRAFVIIPLYDLTPDLILPNGVKIADLFRRVGNHQLVKIG